MVKIRVFIFYLLLRAKLKQKLGPTVHYHIWEKFSINTILGNTGYFLPCTVKSPLKFDQCTFKPQNFKQKKFWKDGEPVAQTWLVGPTCMQNFCTVFVFKSCSCTHISFVLNRFPLPFFLFDSCIIIV